MQPGRGVVRLPLGGALRAAGAATALKYTAVTSVTTAECIRFIGSSWK